MSAEHLSLAEIVGPWEEPQFQSGLIGRCRNAWAKPISGLSDQELATCIRQKLALAHLLPIAKRRIADQIEDGTEIYDGELSSAIEEAEGRPNQTVENNSDSAPRNLGGPLQS